MYKFYNCFLEQYRNFLFLTLRVSDRKYDVDTLDFDQIKHLQ